MQEIEINTIDRRLESKRLANKQQEEILLASICEQGIREPLQGVQSGENLLLLDGFKRLRCSEKLRQNMVPVIFLDSDEARGLIELLRRSVGPSLHTLEEAALIDELKNQYNLSVTEIGRQLDRSPAWVSLRLGILSEMSEEVRRTIFAGKFPVRAWMYNLRPFTRVKKIPTKEINRFVEMVSGRHLSLRQIAILTEAYFKGSEKIKEQIDQGKIDWTLEQLNPLHCEKSVLIPKEKLIIEHLEATHKWMDRLVNILKPERTGRSEFLAEADLIVESLLGIIPRLQKRLELWHDSHR